jgi:hypothetical protein
VLADDGSSVGAYSSRADAIKHQRHLYANEARVASLYAELDAQPVPEVEVVQPESKSELVNITIGNEALTSSLMMQMERMSERQTATDQALVAALQAIGERESVVNVAPASVTVEQPSITVESPTVNVEPVFTVEAPQVTVLPADVNVVLPERQKTVTFERDPLTNQVTSADIVET